MICKYCGAHYTGNYCLTCGKVIPLVNRSTDLDVLMSNTPMPKQPVTPVGKTFEQGLREGYQRGLKEGFDNGYKQGKGMIHLATKPPRLNVKMIVFLCAGLFIFGSAVSGLISSSISFKNGYLQGKNVGIDQGKQEGIRVATSTYEPQLKEQYQIGMDQGKVEGYQEGYKAAKKETSSPIESSTSSSEKHDVVATLEQPVNLSPIFPYSRSSNEIAYDPVVQKIQDRLKELNFSIAGEIIVVDGIYGPYTEEAVRMFQIKEKLTVTGEVDMETYLRLFPDEVIHDEIREAAEESIEVNTLTMPAQTPHDLPSKL